MYHLHRMSPYMFGYWADPFVHLLLLKISMAEPYQGRGGGLDRYGSLTSIIVFLQMSGVNVIKQILVQRNYAMLK